MTTINDIKLTDFIIEEWYKDSLIPFPARPQAKDPSPPPAARPALTPPIPPPAPQPTPETAAKTTAPEANTPYKFLGNNRRKITLLVNSLGTAFLPDEQLSFLTKILEACRMTLADVAIVNQATTPVSIATLRQQLTPVTILLFGIEPSAIRLPINFPVFKILAYDQCTYLSAPALEQLVLASEESKLLKSKLWVTLKTLFEV